MTKEKVIPQIRFSGFTDTWEQRKLSAIADKVTEKNVGLQYIETFTNSAEFGIISQRDFFDHDIAKMSSLGGYYIVRSEDFVYNPRISTSAPVGPINRNKLGRIGVMSPLYTVFRPHDIDTTYLEYFFKSKYWHSFMNFNGDSGARSDRFSIKDSVFFEMPIPIPHIDEQKKIGAFLDKLDSLITLHQRKYDKLTKAKKAMLKKMFPQNGANKPEIRFRGFTDGWEHCKLNSIADVRDGTHASPQYFSSGHPFITSKNVKDGYINYDDVQYISDEDYEEINKRSKVDVNDILMGMIGTIGNLALIREEPDFAIKNVALIKDTGDIFYLYLYHYLQSETVLNQLLENMDGGTQKFVALKRIRELNIAFPIKSEQQAIGTYFHNLDSVITLHQRKCDKYKSIKAGLIRKLFP